MRRLIAIMFGAAVVGMTGSAIAQTTAPTTTKEAKEQKTAAKKDVRRKAMDTNNDGMISKEEFNEVSRNDVAEGEAKRQGAGHVG